MSLTGRSNNEVNAQISGGDYWPALQLADFIKQFRLPVEHKIELVTNELHMAALAVQAQLKPLEQTVPVESESVEHVLYQHGVFTLARAHIGKHFLALGSKETNDVQADVDDNSYGYWMGQSEECVVRLLRRAGKSALPAGFTVEAI